MHKSYEGIRDNKEQFGLLSALEESVLVVAGVMFFTTLRISHHCGCN